MIIRVPTAAVETLHKMYGDAPDVVGRLIQVLGDEALVDIAKDSTLYRVFVSDGYRVDDCKSMASAYQESADIFDAIAGFQTFKSSRPAKEMFAKLGFQDLLSASESWSMLRTLVVDLNDNKERGAWVDAARHCDGVCSSGERILLHAILATTDFAWLADELSGGHAWRRMHDAHGEYRTAVAACVAADI